MVTQFRVYRRGQFVGGITRAEALVWFARFSITLAVARRGTRLYRAFDPASGTLRYLEVAAR